MGALLHMYQFFSSLYLTIDDAWAHGREKRPRGTAAEVEVYSSTQTAEERARRLAYTMLPRGTMLREGEGCVEQMNGKVAVDAPVLCGIHNATQEAIILGSNEMVRGTFGVCCVLRVVMRVYGASVYCHGSTRKWESTAGREGRGVRIRERTRNTRPGIRIQESVAKATRRK